MKLPIGRTARSWPGYGRRAALAAVLGTVTAAGLVLPASAAAIPGAVQSRVQDNGNGDVLVSSGSPATLFPRNKQNEPAVAVDPLNPAVAVAGSNDEIDLAPCNGSSCPFTPGVGVSGVYFTTNAGGSWSQPTYTGWSARTGTAAGGGPIGTIPGYYQAGLVSDGDPALAFGPRPDASGHFSWSNGARLYYGNLTSNFPGNGTFLGSEAVAVSYTDNLSAAEAGQNSAWQGPVVVTQQNSALFSDKDALWADNAATSPYFGHVYACNVAFRGQGTSPYSAPEPLMVEVSSDGGKTWAQHQVSAAVDNVVAGGRQFCALRTDSYGTVYLMYRAYDRQLGSEVIMQQLSFDGGLTFTSPQVVHETDVTGQLDARQGRYTIDGVAGSRTSTSPSFDIANGAPSGQNASNEVMVTWSDSRAGLNQEAAYLSYSIDGGRTYSAPAAISQAGDRANQPAVAISPDGSRVWLDYNAYLQPWQATTAQAREELGVVRTASVVNGVPGAFTTVHRGVTGDARASAANSLGSEFLGDYNDITADAGGAVAVWNDVRSAADCPAIDTYRQSLVSGSPIAKPAPPAQCPAAFGNSDIYGGTYLNP